ncbi:AraC family transcriptional regulator [Edaphocola aurantiacus]|uniref:AraC family transcriptional regulator n=1 Tax=Edaphocola aurantiacus TaxID=2601682 RepID=UPI001C974115|nr:AraC family transcriptional regulator [Edaphocola aurantiacus]
MKQEHYEVYKYSEDEVRSNIARYVYLDNPESYPFDHYHGHEYNEIMVFLKGGGTHNISFKDYSIEDQSIHLIAARDLHWVERSMHSEGFAIVYKDQLLDKLSILNSEIDFQDIFNRSRIINLNEEDQVKFALLFQEMQANKGDKLYMLQLIGAFLTRIATVFHDVPGTSRTNDPLLKQVVSLIHKHFKDRWTPDQYAAALHVTARTLQNRIKQASGKSLRQLEQERLLKEARQLLMTSGLPVNEIALELGFKETAHFSNWFKMQSGQSPSEYKA